MPLVKGTKVIYMLKVNVQKIKSNALFVTRFDENVLPSDIVKYIFENAGIKHLEM